MVKLVVVLVVGGRRWWAAGVHENEICEKGKTTEKKDKFFGVKNRARISTPTYSGGVRGDEQVQSRSINEEE